MTFGFGVLPKKQPAPLHDYILMPCKSSSELSFSISIANFLIGLEFILYSFIFQVDSLLSQHHWLNNYPFFFFFLLFAWIGSYIILSKILFPVFTWSNITASLLPPLFCD